MNYTDYPVLFVDDDIAVLKAFELAYGEDLTVLCHDSPQDALNVLKGNQPVAIVLADERMPALKGSDFLAEAQRLRPAAVRMLVTAYADLPAIARAVNGAQIARYVPKPWGHQKLLSTLQEGIRQFAGSPSPNELPVLLKVIGVNVRRLRKERGFTQLTLSLASKLNKRTIEMIEHGQINASFGSVLAIANALGVDIRELQVEPPK